MIDRLIADPAFLPITIIFLLLVIIAIWQKLDRYIIPLTIVFIVYGVFTFFTHPNEEIKYSIPMKDIVPAVTDTSEQIQENHIADTLTVDPVIEITKEPEIIVTEKQADEKPELPDLHVNSLLMCEGMIDSLRKPIRPGKEFSITLKRVYCYSGIRNALSARTILYEWYFQGNYIDTIPIKIGRSVYWRSWTYKTISDAQIGDWYVVIRDEITAAAMDTVHFTIIDL